MTSLLLEKKGLHLFCHQEEEEEEQNKETQQKLRFFVLSLRCPNGGEGMGSVRFLGHAFLRGVISYFRFLARRPFPRSFSLGGRKKQESENSDLKFFVKRIRDSHTERVCADF